MKKQCAVVVAMIFPWVVVANDDLGIFEPAIEYQSEQCEWDGQIFAENPIVYSVPKSNGMRTNYTIDQSGHNVRQINLAINQTDRPVILELNAYEPTIWNIGWTENTKIVGVYASGYHRQVVAGIESQVPVLTSTYDNQYACKASDTLSKIAKLEKIDMDTPSKAFLAIGEKSAVKLEYVTNVNNPPSSFQLPDHLLSGQAGLTYGINTGLIRPANQRDFQEWENAEQALLDTLVDHNGNKINIEPRSSRFTFSSGKNTFVVLKKYTYPGGLYGAHSVTFIIPKGVPIPDGNPGHSTILDMNSMSCLSSGC